MRKRENRYELYAVGYLGFYSGRFGVGSNIELPRLLLDWLVGSGRSAMDGETIELRV